MFVQKNKNKNFTVHKNSHSQKLDLTLHKKNSTLSRKSLVHASSIYTKIINKIPKKPSLIAFALPFHKFIHHYTVRRNLLIRNPPSANTPAYSAITTASFLITYAVTIISLFVTPPLLFIYLFIILQHVVVGMIFYIDLCSDDDNDHSMNCP
jgi:hypothetical protein